MADDRNIVTMAKALRKLEEKSLDGDEALALLKKIERNTSSSDTGAATRSIGKVVTEIQRQAISDVVKSVATVSRKTQNQAVETASKAVAVAVSSAAVEKAAQRAANKAVRDKGGRFTSNNKPAEVADNSGKLSKLFNSAKSIFGKLTQNERANEVAGRLVFGSGFEVMKQIKGVATDLRDKSKDDKTVVGKMAGWFKGKIGKTTKVGAAVTAGTTVVNSGGGGEKGSVVRDIATEAIGEKLGKTRLGRRATVVAKKAGRTVTRGATTAGRTVASGARTVASAGGSVLRGGASLAARGVAALGGGAAIAAAAGLVAAVGAAVFGVQQFTQALTTGKSGVSDFINWLTQKATGDKNATFGGKMYDAKEGVKNMLGFGPGASIRETIGRVESGNRGYSAYQNKDKGGVSFGKYQFTSSSGSLGDVLEQYAANGGQNGEQAKQYAAMIRAGKGEQLRNDKGFESMLKGTANEKAMQDAQEQVFDKRYYNPAMAYAQKNGINVVKNQRTAGFLADTNVQGGMKEVTQSASQKLATQGLDFKTATEDQQLQALSDARKERLTRIGSNQISSGNASTRANGQMLLNDARDGGRVDQVVSQLKKTKINSETGYETAYAAREGAKSGAAPKAETETKTEAKAATPKVAARRKRTKKQVDPSLGGEAGTPDTKIPEEIKQAEATKATEAKTAVVSTSPTSSAIPSPVIATGKADVQKTGTIQTGLDQAKGIPAVAQSLVSQGKSSIGGDIVAQGKAAAGSMLGGDLLSKGTAALGGSPVDAIKGAGGLLGSLGGAFGTQTASSQSPAPLPKPEPVQPPKPAPIEVKGLDQMAKSDAKPDVPSPSGVPKIKTEFDDTTLVLMMYDRV